MTFISSILINTLTLLIVSYTIPGFKVKDLISALIASVIIGLINTFVRPILFLITLPLNIITLGFFTFILNVCLLLMVAAITPGFYIDNLLAAFLGSLLVSLVSSFLNIFLKPTK